MSLFSFIITTNYLPPFCFHARPIPWRRSVVLIIDISKSKYPGGSVCRLSWLVGRCKEGLELNALTRQTRFWEGGCGGLEGSWHLLSFAWLYEKRTRSSKVAWSAQPIKPRAYLTVFAPHIFVDRRVWRSGQEAEVYCLKLASNGIWNTDRNSSLCLLEMIANVAL